MPEPDLDLQRRFPDMQPVSSPPSLYTVYGIGPCVSVSLDVYPETGTYIKTHWICFLFLPLVAIGAYRVADAPGRGWYFLGRQRLSGAAKLWNLVLVLLLL